MAEKVVQKRIITETTKSDGSKKTTIKENLPSKSNKVKIPKKKRLTTSQREEMLIENFVGLQHAMTNLSIKFGSLTEQINNLLRVYEESALSFAQGGKVNDKEMLDKINNLLEQNKTIAKGLVMMESKLRNKTVDLSSSSEQSMPSNNFSNFQSSINNQQPRNDQNQMQKPKPLPRL